MTDNDLVIEKLHEKFADFQKNMEEIYLLRRVAADLKSFRKMIRLKRYD